MTFATFMGFIHFVIPLRSNSVFLCTCSQLIHYVNFFMCSKCIMFYVDHLIFIGSVVEYYKYMHTHGKVYGEKNYFLSVNMLP